MSILITQRCLHHPSREAVARCPECTQYYCRECITEHDDRAICAACLKKLVSPTHRPARRVVPIWRFASAIGGFVFAFVFFYLTGRMLLSLPDDFHEGNLWELKVLQSLNPDEE